MAVDKNKIIAEATKLVQKGALDKAIATYQRILAEDAKDVRVLLKVGELYQKKGDERLAADAFTRVAETYAEQGFFLKAVAVYKQIVKLAPDDVRVNERLAGLYQQLGLMSDAMGQLQYMAAAHEKAGDAGKLTDVLQRMVELDPENIASSIKLGELHARAGRPGPAMECLRRAADYLKKHSRTDEYLKVAERIAALQPDDLGLTKELANIYLAKGDTKRALAKLQLCFKTDPKDVDTLHLLAQAFRDLGQTSKTLSVFKELAHVHEEQGRHADARATWKKVQELSPDDVDAAAALGLSHPAASPPPTPMPRPAVVAAPPPGPPPGVRSTPLPRPGGLGAATGSDAVQKLLTETDVYVKYGLHDKALEHLRKVLAVDPNSPDAHERAREIHLAAGRPSEAGDAGVAAVRAWLARGMPDRARDALFRLRHIDPGNPSLAELARAAGSTEELEVVEELTEVAEVALDPATARTARADEDEVALRAAREASEELVEDEEGLAPAAGVRARGRRGPGGGRARIRPGGGRRRPGRGRRRRLGRGRGGGGRAGRPGPGPAAAPARSRRPGAPRRQVPGPVGVRARGAGGAAGAGRTRTPISPTSWRRRVSSRSRGWSRTPGRRSRASSRCTPGTRASWPSWPRWTAGRHRPSTVPPPRAGAGRRSRPRPAATRASTSPAGWPRSSPGPPTARWPTTSSSTRSRTCSASSRRAWRPPSTRRTAPPTTTWASPTARWGCSTTPCTSSRPPWAATTGGARSTA